MFSKHMKIKAYGKVKEVDVIAEGVTEHGNKLILAQVPFELDPRLTAFVIYQWHPIYMGISSFWKVSRFQRQDSRG